jgi:hypothetical protein
MLTQCSGDQILRVLYPPSIAHILRLQWRSHLLDNQQGPSTTPIHVGQQPSAKRRQLEPKVAMMANVSQLTGFLSDYLKQGMQASLRKLGEEYINFTDAVRLYLGSEQDKDFKVEIWLCASVGKLSQKNRRT